jgi:hypothetical protein
MPLAQSHPMPAEVGVHRAACFCLPSIDTSSSYTHGTFLSAPAAPQISPNRLMQPVWRAQRSITFTTSPRADAIRVYKRCASASTRVHCSHNIRRKSNPNRQACQRPLSRVLHPHLLLVVRRLRWVCTVRPVSARPASTPLPLTHREPSYPPLQPLKSHQTGSRNPFGVPNAPSPPPLPRAPTL